MLEIILAIVAFVGLLGTAVMVLRKVPAMVSLPEKAAGDPLMAKIRSQVRHLPGSEAFDYEVHLQKILSHVRVLTLKTEQKTGTWLERLRKKNSQKRNNRDDYWDELKKAKDGK